MPKNMKPFLYDGPEKKVHAGGYSFKAGRPVMVDVDALTDDNKAQFADHKIKQTKDKTADKGAKSSTGAPPGQNFPGDPGRSGEHYDADMPHVGSTPAPPTGSGPGKK